MREMGIYSMCGGGGCSLPCGFNSCMEAEGLFEGVGREEKQSLRRAALAARRFRAAKGYLPDTLWQRLCQKLRKSA